MGYGDGPQGGGDHSGDSPGGGPQGGQDHSNSGDPNGATHGKQSDVDRGNKESSEGAHGIGKSVGQGTLSRWGRKLGNWAGDHMGTVGTVLGTALGAPMLGMAMGNMAKFGAFKGMADMPGHVGQQEGGSSGVAGLSGANMGNETGAAQGAQAAVQGTMNARPFGATADRTPTNTLPSYEELYAEYNMDPVKPKPLFSYGTEAYRYTPEEDRFTSVYSGETINNPGNISQGIGALPRSRSPQGDWIDRFPNPDTPWHTM
jgi:hypothetical protein